MDAIKISVELKATVPEATTGRLIDAITDIIWPITEILGLIGDKIRLHRAETAFKVVELGMQIARDSGSKLQPIPLKGIVPLLEKSSLEDPEDDEIIAK